MQTEQKLKILGASARYDVCASCWVDPVPRPDSPPPRNIRPEDFITRAVVPGKSRCVRLFKVLQTNYCRHNCLYCVNRRDLDRPRTSFRPDELASLFINLVRARKVDGLFLSSGISDSPVAAQSRSPHPRPPPSHRPRQEPP
jgi:predicted DNA-binding helix-hairpin-helix protein